MKKIIYIAVLIGIWINTTAQNQVIDKCFDAKWDWMVYDNWKIYTDAHPNGILKNPFPEDVDGELDRIRDESDLSPQEGWILIKKRLGCVAETTNEPYVIFYNKYTGIFRIMGYHQYEEVTNIDPCGLMSVQWGDGEITSNLTFSNNLAYANEHYPEKTDDIVLTQISDFSRNSWWVTEFKLAFDHRTTFDLEENAFSIRLYGIQTGELTLNLTADLSTKAMEFKGPASKKASSENGDFHDWLVDAQKFNTKIQFSKFDEFVEQVKANSDSVHQWIMGSEWADDSGVEAFVKSRTAISAYKLSENIEDGSLGNVLKGIGEVAGYIDPRLKYLLNIVPVLTGKANKSASTSGVPFTPSVTAGTIEGTGQIQTKSLIMPIKRDLPGGTDTTINQFQYYTCPLGVIGLEKEPAYSERRWEERKIKASIVDDMSYLGVEIIDASPITEKWKSICIDENLKIAINSASGLEVELVEVAIIGKSRIKSDSTAYYSLKEVSPSYRFESFYNNHNIDVYRLDYDVQYPPDIVYEGKISDIWRNKTRDWIKNGTYRISTNEIERVTNGEVKFSTQFVDIRDFKGTVFTVREETDIWLKIKAYFKVIDGTTTAPAPFTHEYLLTPLTDSLIDTDSMTPFPFSRSQLSGYGEVDSIGVVEYEGSYSYLLFPKDTTIAETITTGNYTDVNIIESTDTVYVVPGDSVIFAANLKVVLKPGFTATAGGKFRAYIDTTMVAPYKNSTPLTDIVKYYKNGVAYDTPQYCDCSPVSQNKSLRIGQTEEKKDKLKQETEEIEISVYPNPTNNGLLKIDCTNLQEDTKGYITVFDLQGRTVFSSTILKNTNNVDITTAPAGIYILRVITNEKTFNSKILKQ